MREKVVLGHGWYSEARGRTSGTRNLFLYTSRPSITALSTSRRDVHKILDLKERYRLSNTREAMFEFGSYTLEFSLCTPPRDPVLLESRTIVPLSGGG